VNSALIAQTPKKAAVPAEQRSEKTKPVTIGQAPDKAHQAPTAQAPHKTTTSAPRATGQTGARQRPSKGAAPDLAVQRRSKIRDSSRSIA
jgi:hypothetical protein